MTRLLIILLTLTSLSICKANGSSVVTTAKAPACDCISPIYVNKPTDISQCYSGVKYQNQVYQSYIQIFTKLFSLNMGKGCDFTEYRTLLQGMQRQTYGIIKSLYDCTQSNCTESVLNGYKDYLSYRNSLFNGYTKCSMATLPVECSQVLFTIRPLAYASAENTMTSMLACSALKTANTMKCHAIGSEPLSIQNTIPDCNCILISTRPIPNNASECFSAKFISKVNSFITDNHNAIADVYDSNRNSTCDYSQFKQLISRFKEIAYGFAVLTQSTPTFDEVNAMVGVYSDTRTQYSDTMRSYILNHDKSYYFIPRKARQNPLAITDNVIAVLNKCVAYRDKSVRMCGA